MAIKDFFARSNACSATAPHPGKDGAALSTLACFLRGSLVGYAGGLGPDNIKEQLPRIAAAAGDCFFCIDLEGKLRTSEDFFDLGIGEDFLKKTAVYVLNEEHRVGAQHGHGIRKVSELEGFWLDYWVAVAQDEAVVVPHVAASRVKLAHRAGVAFMAFSPSEDTSLAKDILTKQRICLMPVNPDQWKACKSPNPGEWAESNWQTAEDMFIAGLRAVVQASFGDTVPENPALAYVG